MPDLIPRDEILDVIKENISGIALGSTYWTTVNLATREHKWFYDWEEGDLPAVSVLAGSEAHRYPGGHREVGDFAVIIRGTIGEHPPATLATRLERLIEDCKTAVSLDSTLGGLSYNLEIIRIDTDEGWAVPRACFEMEVAVSYGRTRAGR